MCLIKRFLIRLVMCLRICFFICCIIGFVVLPGLFCLCHCCIKHNSRSCFIKSLRHQHLLYLCIKRNIKFWLELCIKFFPKFCFKLLIKFFFELFFKFTIELFIQLLFCLINVILSDICFIACLNCIKQCFVCFLVCDIHAGHKADHQNQEQTYHKILFPVSCQFSRYSSDKRISDFFLFHTNLHSCAVFKRITSLCASTAPYHSRSAAEILCSLISLWRTAPSRSLMTWSAICRIASLCVTMITVLPYLTLTSSISFNISLEVL